MKCIFRELTVVSAVLALLSGCANTAKTPDSSSTSDDANYTKAQGTAVGAGLGAVLGGVIGNVVGG